MLLPVQMPTQEEAGDTNGRKTSILGWLTCFCSSAKHFTKKAFEKTVTLLTKQTFLCLDQYLNFKAKES